MPVVFVHGVNVRQDNDYAALVAQRDLRLQELLLSPLLPNPHAVRIFNPYWGRYAASLAWGGISLPSSQVAALDLAQAPNADEQLIELLLAGNNTTLPSASNRTLVALAHTSLADAVDVLFALASQPLANAADSDDLQSLLQLSANVYSYIEAHPNPAWLATVQSDSELLAHLRRAVEKEQPASPQSLGLTDHWGMLGEGLDRFRNIAGSLGSQALLYFAREPLNNAVSHFLGDVLVYLDERGTQATPGPILTEIANQLEQAQAAIDPVRDPYLIVIAHSMGGNITYDLLTHFYANRYPVDLLITVGSQVALFEELKLYKESQKQVPIDPRQERIAKPASVKAWLNVYDPNDVLSYAAAGVFDGVTDFVYSTGKHLISAHTAYFLRGSFYHRLSKRIQPLLQKQG